MTEKASPPFTVMQLKGPADRLALWRRIPALTLEAVRLAWRASSRHFAASTALQLFAAGTVAVQLLVARWVLRELVAVSRGAEAAPLVGWIALLLLLTILLGVFGALALHYQRFLTEYVARHTFDRIIDVSARVELASFEDPSFYDQLSRARTSGLSRPIEMVNGISTLVMSLLTSLGIGIALLTMHALLLPLVVLAGIPILIATLYNSRQAYEFEYGWTPQSRERLYLMALLTGKEPAKEMRVFGATPFLRRRYDALTEERFTRLRKFLQQRVRVALAGAIAGAIGAAVALGSLGWLVFTGRIDVATAVTAGLGMQLLMSRFSAMTKSLGSLVEAGMFLDDYRTFIALGDAARQREAKSAGAGKDLHPFEELRVEGVSFTYPNSDALVLQDVSLVVRPGEVIALVGENGSGKTTLVKLICQLYRPQAGRILWNGVDSASIDPDELQSDITVLFQDFIHYHLTVFDNIALGRAEPAPELSQVTAAAKRAGAHGFLSFLPEGYDTRLGRQFYGGYELSMGQWQKLALARSFFRDASFLILDEPTASLDPRAEHELFQQMRALSHGRSVLLVSHRFSSVRNADRIYVLQGGRVIESGSHEELMARAGHYAELYSLQATAYLGQEPKIATLRT